MVDVDKARRWLRARRIDACPLCKYKDLRVSRDLYVLLAVHGATKAPDLRRGSTLVRVRCARCAHIMLFHARRMGQEVK